jgi:hypothetical protein
MDPGAHAAGLSQSADGISDRRFAAQLESIQRLKQFLFDEKVLFHPDNLENIDLGSLNKLKYDAGGRLPTEAEWKALDQKLASLAPLLTPALRRKLRIRELHFFFKTIPIVFIATTIVATFVLLLLMTVGSEERRSYFFLAPYMLALLIWTLAQGALGACAFLSVSATVDTAKETSASNALYPAIDVTDDNNLSIRIILGALFALLVALPIAGRSVLVLFNAFTEEHPLPTAEDWISVLVPFLFGFSTTLVLAIFNRIIAGVSSLFGISGETTTRRE